MQRRDLFASGRSQANRRRASRQVQSADSRQCVAAINHADPLGSAEAVGLRYVTDKVPGIQRLRSGQSFRYRDQHGKLIRDRAVLQRIRSLAIPPAWRQVWICCSANGHLQATGRDAAGRKQYRYHPRWTTVRSETKYHQMLAFGKCLPRIRRRIERDLARRNLPREKVLATVVRLLERTLIRIGNDEYARNNHSFGLTTMHDRHAKVFGANLIFEFRGKGGINHRVRITDRRLAEIVRRCRQLPGHELFQYQNGDGTVQTIGSGDVNDYLRSITGQDFTAKDFRTWAGTVLAAQAIREFKPFSSQTEAKRNIVRAIETVAQKLRNTKAVCRKCYVHPAVFDAYLDGSFPAKSREPTKRRSTRSRWSLSPDEVLVMSLIAR